VCASTGVQVKVADVDQPQLLARGGRNLAHAHGAGLFGGGVANFHGAIVGDDLVGQPFGGFELLRTEFGGREVDGAGVVAHVERYGGKVEEPLESSRNHMLAGMLLHVIAAPVSVNLSLNQLSRSQPVGGGLEDMQYLAVGFDLANVGYLQPFAAGRHFENAGIGVLPAAGGIKR